MTARPSLLAALCVCAALAAGCGKQTVVAGLFFQTPALPNPAAPGTNLGPYALLTGYVSTIDITDPTKIQDAQIVGVDTAKATIVYRSCEASSDPASADACRAGAVKGEDRVLAVKGMGGGLYTLFSTDEPKLTYEQGVRYTLILEVPTADGLDVDAYGASFVPGPAPSVVEFKDKAQPKSLAHGEGMTLTRDDAPVNGQLLPAFALVAKVDPLNPTALPEVTYMSLDYKDPKALLLLALSDQPYRKASYDIPSEAFATDGAYIVGLLSIQEGKASSNAFVGSTSLSGSGDAGLVQVGPVQVP